MSAGARTSPLEIETGPAAPEAGPRVLAPFGRRLCRVSSCEPVGAYRMLAAEDPQGPRPLAGQFYMLAASEGWGGSPTHGERPYLARAFSVCRVRDDRLEFLLEAIGPGTERLARLDEGDGLWVLGPLGIGFDSPPADAGAPPLLVGGGIGVAPLVIWAEGLAEAGVDADVLLGFRSAPYVAAAGLFGGTPRIATDDGTAPAGIRARAGLVTGLLEDALAGVPRPVYACGPPPMLEAVRRICAERGAPCQLAMEAGMACGFGACFGCVLKTRSGYRRLCVDGPVVDAADLDPGWEH
jgi:dihydroorotate dehydrogenase electron transfer subunit